jgi:hypothetical protein
MSQVAFGDLKAGDVFTHNGREYSKTEKVKISCCKYINAQCLSVPRDKATIPETQMVEVKDQ